MHDDDDVHVGNDEVVRGQQLEEKRVSDFAAKNGFFLLCTKQQQQRPDINSRKSESFSPS